SRAISTFEGVTDWTFAKLTLKASSAGFHQTRGGNARIRFIGNSINGVNSSYGTVGLKGCTECKILGNHVWNSGKAGNKLAHLIYYGGYGVGANLQIAYNLLHDERGGRCIQVYGHTDADRLSELSIHDNIIYNCPYDGILVGSSDAVFKPWISAASIHHNIVYNSGGGIRINSSGVAAQVFNNTLHNNSVNLKFETAKTVNAYKNISSLPKSSHASIKIFPTMHGNGWWRGPAPAQGAGHIVSDPLFVNATAGDFRLQPESPMYGLGAIVPPLLPPLPLPPPPACVCP
ncbi:MAG: hypothetical protein ACREXR_00615, partial [Gammaproteobacteria bacterium]